MYELRPLSDPPMNRPRASATGVGAMGGAPVVHAGVSNAAFAPDGAPHTRPYTTYDMPVDVGALEAGPPYGGSVGAPYGADGFEPIDGIDRVDGVPRARLHTPAQVQFIMLNFLPTLIAKLS